MKFLVLTYAVVSAMFVQDFKMPAPLGMQFSQQLGEARRSKRVMLLH